MFLIPMTALIITGAVAVQDTPTKLAGFPEDTASPVEITVEETEGLKRAKFEVTEHERTTSEEEVETVSLPLSEKPVEDPTVSGETEEETEPESEIQTTAESDSTPYYSYKGREVLDERLQYHLWDLWQRFDMPDDWYPYVIGLIYQECSFHSDSVHHNADGSVDIGYFQYNSRWFDGTAAKFGADLDITNNFHQAYLFVVQTKWRMEQGLSMEECISRHRRGDYDGYDAEYVAMVFERTSNLIKE